MTPQNSLHSGPLSDRARSGAHWFYWIAALSLVTSIISLAGGGWGFFLSLGVTQLINAFAAGLASELGWGFKVVALVFDLIAAGLFALIGYFASKRHTWAFVVGMAVYALDALLFVIFFHLLALAFHGFALYSMYSGYKACVALVDAAKQAPAPDPAATV
jgi:hypothetical protein